MDYGFKEAFEALAILWLAAVSWAVKRFFGEHDKHSERISRLETAFAEAHQIAQNNADAIQELKQQQATSTALIIQTIQKQHQ